MFAELMKNCEVSDEQCSGEIILLLECCELLVLRFLMTFRLKTNEKNLFAITLLVTYVQFERQILGIDANMNPMEMIVEQNNKTLH